MGLSQPSLSERLAGRTMWVPGAAWLAVGTSTLYALHHFVHPSRIDWLTRLYTRGQVVAAGVRTRTVVDPAVRTDRQYVFCQNHVSLIDHCTAYGATPHFKQGIELASHFTVPFYGRFMRNRGTIPVDRDASPKLALKDLMQRVHAEVDQGHSLLLFPEGTRTRDGRVGPFHSGVLRVAHRLGLPFVPVTVTGMHEIMAKDSPYIFPGGQITVYVDSPIETAGVPRAQLPQLVEQVRGTMAKRVDAYYQELGHKPRC